MSRRSPSAPAAAGAVPWRRDHGRLQVAIVHRRRYDDWSWPKGKLDEGEDWPAAAVREVHEEMGVRVALGVPLPTASYSVHAGSGRKVTKQVRYWAAHVVGGDGRLTNEVDDVRWVTIKQARHLLTYGRDRDQLDAVVEAAAAQTLVTWPLVVVRHAKAVPRKTWKGREEDWLRPLDARGLRQSKDLVAVLAAYDVRRVVTSSSTRCVQTVEPYAASRGLTLHPTRMLSEEGFKEEPDGLVVQLDRLLLTGTPKLVCSHGPLLPSLAGLLGERVTSKRSPAARALRAIERRGMAKGEAVVCHVSGRGESARIVAVERHRPLR